MKILGIDYGRRKVGLAIGEGGLAEPLEVIRFQDSGSLYVQIRKIVESEGFQKVVVGISEGKMGEETEKFVRKLEKELAVPIETFDETLTSKDAQALSIESGGSRSKRKKMEDAYAASIMLQNYLDSR
jgi:putative Holliday junction resolvase